MMCGLERGRRAFIFSIDAFVAFSLVMLAIYSLFILVSVPESYYSTYEQAYDLASDTLVILDRTNESAGTTYVEEMFDCALNSGSCNFHQQNARKRIDEMIPEQWGYRVDFYDAAVGEWENVYDTSYQDNPHKDRYQKVQASSTIFVQGYSRSGMPDQGQSPYCYITGEGYGLYDGDYQTADAAGEDCTRNLCNPPTSNFNAGDLKTGLIKLTVYI